jgi:hypothetical protein
MYPQLFFNNQLNIIKNNMLFLVINAMLILGKYKNL